MEKRALIFVLSIAMLLLVSCQARVPAGEKPVETAAALKMVQSGTQGLELGFISRYPPSEIYDIDQFVALIELKNRGNHDLAPEDCFVQLTGFDPNIIRGIDYIQSCGEIEGKNVYNLEGGFNQIEFKSSNLQLPEKTFEYNPRLNLVACYKYQTNANPLVCVDPLFYQVTSEQKSCLVKDVSMGGGQGAPVGIGYTGVDMAGGKAIFEINVVNYGTGRVLSPYADISNCGQASLSYEDLDKVAYNVELTGGSPISCKPSDRLVRLVNNQGKIVCSFNIPAMAAYETPLRITLDYNYLQSYQQPIRVIKTPS